MTQTVVRGGRHMTSARISRVCGTILLTITTGHCERSAAIQTRVVVATTVLVLTLAASASAKYSGGTGVPNDPYQIATAADLIALGETPEDYDKHFILIADIDLNPNLPGRKVFDKAVIAPDTDPVSRYFQGIPFLRVFDGNGHVISNLVIDAPTKEYVGLIAQIGEEGLVKNLGLQNCHIKKAGVAGALVGENKGITSSCYSSGTVEGSYAVGGLAGYNNKGTIISSHTTGNAEGESVGGLVGVNVEGNILSSSSSCVVIGHDQIGDVIGFMYAGGLVGRNANGTISSSSSIGSVVGDYLVGGLVGVNLGTIYSSYSSSSVIGHTMVGGLVGENIRGSIFSCYSTGSVTGGSAVGGLVGKNWRSSTLLSFSTGTVIGYDQVGGLIGESFSSAFHLCYWDTEASGLSTSSGGEGKTTQQLTSLQTFLGWGYDAQWTLDERQDYPHLKWEGRPGLIITDPPRTYGGGTGEFCDPYQIRTAEDLTTINWYPDDWDASFILMADVNVALIDPNRLLPIGTKGLPFTGTFDGKGHVVYGFKYKSKDESYIGMFGYIGPSNSDVNVPSSTVQQLHLSDVDMLGDDYVGGLTGFNEGTIIDCSVTGRVAGYENAGGLVGGSKGLVQSSCSNIYSAILGYGVIGGLVGDNEGVIFSCYSTGTVTGDWGYVGGLVGYNKKGTVKYSYSTCAIKEEASREGGLVGGIHGEYGIVTASFWDIQTSGSSGVSGGIGKTTAEMQTAKTFLEAGWDFVGETANGTEDIW